MPVLKISEAGNLFEPMAEQSQCNTGYWMFHIMILDKSIRKKRMSVSFKQNVKYAGPGCIGDRSSFLLRSIVPQ